MPYEMRCPDYPEKHKRFKTTAVVREVWVVDKDGAYLDTAGVDEIIERPNMRHEWVCYECGAKAVLLQYIESATEPVVALGTH